MVTPTSETAGNWASRRALDRDVLGVALLLALHAFLVWGYTGPFWGDLGRWSHEVERFARGELPYRDFQWHFPPLGIWVEGTIAKLAGTSRDALSFVTLALAMVVAIASVLYARRVLQRRDAWLSSALFVLAISYAQSHGPPLPEGLYTPAALVGSLCIAVAASAFMAFRDAPSIAAARTVALFCGLAVISKQDFWAPAFVLAVSVLASTRRWDVACLTLAPIALGIGIIGATAGGHIFLPLLGGFGHIAVTGGRGLPSWERLTVDLFVLTTLVFAHHALVSIARKRILVRQLAISAGLAAVLAAVHVYHSLHTILPADGQIPSPTQTALAYPLMHGQSLLRPSIKWLLVRAAQTPIPVLLAPLLLCVVAMRWRTLPAERKRTLALLLVFALALRTRRAFEGSEWVEFLLAAPVFLATAETVATASPEETRRFRTASLAALTVAALVAYRGYGHGWGTSTYFPNGTRTTRGVMHWEENAVGDYDDLTTTLNSIDPSRTRPLVALGYTGGFNYFLERRNPFPMTQDFYFSAFNADSVLRARPAKLFLLEVPHFKGRSFEAPRLDWGHWELGRVATPIDWYDTPRFQKLAAGCARITLPHSSFIVYDCP